METIFTVGGIPFTGYGLGAAGAMLLFLLVHGVWCRVKGVSYGAFIRFAALAVPMVWFCSRLVFVLANCTYYLTTLSNPALALRFWDGGYSMMGAVGGAVLAAFAAEKWTKTAPGRLLDGVGFAAPIGILLERFMEGSTGMGVGRPVYAALPALFTMTDETEQVVHAVYRDEFLVAALLFAAICLWLIIRGKRPLPGGDVLLVFLTLFGCTQVLLESLRNDGHMVVHFVRIQQVIAVILPVIALGVWTKRLSGHTKRGRILGLWGIVLMAIGVGVWEEFAIDSSEQLWLDYGVMALALTAIACVTLLCGHAARKIAVKG